MPERIVVMVFVCNDGMKIQLPNGSYSMQMSMPPEIREAMGDRQSIWMDAILNDAGQLTLMNVRED